MNEMCKNCHAKEVCEINSFIKQYSDIVDVNITNCTVYSKNQIDKITELKDPINVPQLTPTPRLLNARGKDLMKDYNQRSVIQFEKPIEDKDKIMCNSCKLFYHPKDIVECSCCHEKICLNCSIQNPDGKHFCESCWEEEK